MTGGELRKAMEAQFGSFGDVCLNLCELRKHAAGKTDNELGDIFELWARRHRRCFNKKEFILSCREPD